MIQNVIFDFGGVFLNLDFNRSFSAFEELGFKNIRELFTQYSAAPIIREIEIGVITPDEFYEGMRKIAGRPVTDEQLRTAWNAMLLDYRKPSLDFLIPLADQYNLFLLSNTNRIHHEHFSKTLQDETGYASLESFFTKAWFSHEIHRRKPDLTTYEFVLDNAGLIAAETLFIDDSYTNLPHAKELGMQTHLLLQEERIENLEILQ
ncbi:HAD family hydrolase [Niabella ginsenosidivorans]|uniref:HAD family hydrolase n=1 Tax=Niabella ginsenosidivorans TaxID=1176587 RepID=A0A1A9I9V3_9BACT|nr:HAD family phosphatase [Niabella ginsenosidivorans]ANH83510.1 HAD family hydrolase [Niabella ginsenosidivorans]